MKRNVLFLLFLLIEFNSYSHASSPILSITNTKLQIELSNLGLTDRGYKVILSSDNTKAFVAYRGGVKIINISDNENPIVLATYSSSISHSGNIDYGTNNIVLSPDETRLYLTNNKTLKILDISDLNTIVLLGSINTYKELNSIVVSRDETRAYAIGEFQLRIIDISDKTNPSIINYTGSPLYITDGRDITISSDDNTLYVEGADRKLMIIDVQDSQTPAILYQSNRVGGNPSNEFSNIKLSDDGLKLYITNMNDGKFSIYNISDKTAPVLLDSLNGYLYLSGVAISQDETKAYLSDSKGVHVIDISDKSNITETHKYFTSRVNGITLSRDDTKVYTVSNNDLFRIIDITTKTTIEKITNSGIHPENAVNIVVSNDETKEYLASSSRGLAIANITDPSNIPMPDYYTDNNGTFTSALALNSDETKAYIFNDTDDNIIVLNLSNLTPLGTFHIPNSRINHIKISRDNTKLFLIKDTNLTVLDVSDSTNISQIAEYNIGTKLEHFALSQDESKVYIRRKKSLWPVSVDDGLWILNIADLNNISQLSYTASNVNFAQTIKDENIEFDDIKLSPNKERIFKDNGEILDANTLEIISQYATSPSPFSISKDETKLFRMDTINITPIIFLEKNFAPYNLNIILSDSDQDNLDITVDIDDTTIATVGAYTNSFVYNDYNNQVISIPINHVNNKTGIVTLTITANDGTMTSTKKIYLKIYNLNKLPTITSGAINTTEETSVSGVITATDEDGDDNALKFSIINQGTKGNMALNQDGTYTYTPIINMYGSDTVQISVKDDLNASSTTNITVNISAVNDEPSLILGNATVNNTASRYKLNYTMSIVDVDNNLDSSNVTVTQAPANGSVTINANNIVYSLTNSTLSDTFKVSVSDGSLSNEYTINPAITLSNSVDWDSNGIPDSVEGIGNTNTDGDVLPDWQDDDDDDDGLSDSDEIRLGSDKLTQNDTNSDNLSVSLDKVSLLSLKVKPSKLQAYIGNIKVMWVQDNSSWKGYSPINAHQLIINTNYTAISSNTELNPGKGVFVVSSTNQDLITLTNDTNSAKSYTRGWSIHGNDTGIDLNVTTLACDNQADRVGAVLTLYNGDWGIYLRGENNATQVYSGTGHNTIVLPNRGYMVWCVVDGE